MKKTKLAIAATALVFGLTACIPAPGPSGGETTPPPAGGGETSPGGGGGVVSPAPGGGENSPGGGESSPAPDGGENSPGGGGEGPATNEAKFGDTYRWEDGLEITIGKPTDAEFANKYEEERATGDVVAFSVSVTNGSDENIEASRVNMKVVSDGSEASTFYGSNYRSPSSSIRPGKSLKWNVAYEVADKSDLEMEVSFYDQVHEEVFFTQE
ncbi:DUF5067 domain-containing protein [Micrococcoides hystricis]|uniref:DUF5067 domain-containing protein n=1 Tax=Micrococcoides hystricis TaxID=1572761 RepID=A0ABV6PCY9_9MICC